jgi:hypothetical protein
MGKFCFSLVLGILLLPACREYTSEALTGSWRASSVVEEGDTLDLDLANVFLDFTEDRQFHYQHTQLDSLSGVFKLSDGLINLYVLSPSPDTIIIQLADLTDKSMILRMNHDGRERLVTMVR